MNGDMPEIGTQFLVGFFRDAADRLEENRARLCALDGEVGDGDHGTSMANGFAAVARMAPQSRTLAPDPFLRAAASAFLSDVGATVGPLYASAFVEGAHACGEGNSSSVTLDRLIAAFAEGIAARGKAGQGDKTMLDAWLPAVHAAQEAARGGAMPAEVARRAVEAGRRGAEATATMIASRGRAARLKERSLGHLDPGAVSAVLILEFDGSSGSQHRRRRAVSVEPRRGGSNKGRSRDQPPRGPLRYGDDPLLWASWLYYEEGLTQNEIAASMGVSRPTVNAYLAEARAQGIVTISIEGDRLKSLSVARQIQEQFGLDECLVVPSDGGERSLFDRLGAAGAQALSWLIRSGDRVGITWGRTMLAVANAVGARDLRDVRVVQATGGTTALIPWTPEACATRLAEALGARCIPISAPAILSSAYAKRVLEAEPVVAEQLAELASIDRIVFSVSSLRPDSTIHTSGFFDSALQQRDHYNAAVGALAGRFIDAHGTPIVGPLAERTLGIELEALREVATRVAVAGGTDKVPAILAALRGGYASVLVTDSATGEGILRADGAEPVSGGRRRRVEEAPAFEARTKVKKFLNAPRDAVAESLEGALMAFPRHIEAIGRDVRAIRAQLPMREGKVGLVIGGGAGHEPCFLGYAGVGLADAVAVGNVFASPPPDRVLDCTRAASGGAGVLYIYGNYTGDVLNFDMAAELAGSEGIEVRTVLTTDDVASSPAEDRESRRGVAGNVLIFKVAGAACDRMLDLDACERLARKANAATCTMGVGLEPCSLPETQRPSFRLGEGEIEIGIGIHGEPGMSRERMASADAVADQVCDRLIGEMALEPGHRVALLVNSLGATPMMELMILNRRVRQRLAARGAEVARCWVGYYCTSLDMVGASITLMKLDDELLDLLDHPCDGFALRVV